MTFDNAGNAYFGKISSTSSDGLSLTIPHGFDPKTQSYTGESSSSLHIVCVVSFCIHRAFTLACVTVHRVVTERVEGGAMVVVKGAGAGQYRRVVSWPGAACHNSSCTFTINSKLDAPLDASSIVVRCS